MVKHSTPKSGGTSKFRMVVIDAELQEGEIGQLAQAIQGAFGGQRVTAVRLNGPAVRSLPSPEPEEIFAELGGGEVAEDAVELVMEPVPPRPNPTASLILHDGLLTHLSATGASRQSVRQSSREADTQRCD